ncbi:hypothetical protein B0H10DRAFT_2087458 [Mycena sp. CBHHK59/15]|nr:hypothetical protein B0H10DRAFT_2087458 [Mycena sp. CBHHK59/15]
MAPAPPQHAFNFSSSFLPNPSQAKQLRQLARSPGRAPLETGCLRATIASSPRDLVLYDKNIAILKGAVERMLVERELLQQYADDCRTVLSPIRQLPSETLVEIFMLACPAPSLYNDEGNIKARAPLDGIDHLVKNDLLELAKVCSRWHALIVGTPILWDTLDIDYTRSPVRPTKALVQATLDRSANVPLKIGVTALEQGAAPDPDPDVLELLAKHSKRWETAMFLMDTRHYASLSAAKGNLPLLRTASVEEGAFDRSDAAIRAATEAVEMFASAPRLTNFTYAGALSALKRLPWEQLQRFEYYGVDVEDLREVLAVLPRLAEGTCFTLSSVDFLDTPELLTLPSVMSQLGELTVSVLTQSYPNNCIETFLTALTLPKVEVLKFLSADNPMMYPLSWPNASFQEFLARSGCAEHLTSLNFQHVAISTETLVDLLELLPALEVLGVADHPTPEKVDRPYSYTNNIEAVVTNALLRRLIRTRAATCLVPALRSFTCTSTLDFNDWVLLDFVSSRARALPGGGFHCVVRWLEQFEQFDGVRGRRNQRHINHVVQAKLEELGETHGLRTRFVAATPVKKMDLYDLGRH